jgi:hypothetical protein
MFSSTVEGVGANLSAKHITQRELFGGILFMGSVIRLPQTVTRACLKYLVVSVVGSLVPFHLTHGALVLGTLFDNPSFSYASILR